jgi:cobalt-zinc-cadmium efflux system protein
LTGVHAPGHEHDHRLADRRSLLIALALIVGFMLAEVAAGIGAGSLALLADAGHMLTDAAAIGTSLFAARLAARPAAGSWTFGWKRAEVLSAQANGISLLVVSVVIAVEAVRRLVHPPAVHGFVLVAVAAAGVVVNLAASRVLASGSRRSINVEGAYRHLVTDLVAFAGTFVAGVVILLTHVGRADAIAALLVVVLMLRTAWQLLAKTGRVLLEAAPEGVAPQAIVDEMLADQRVESVHDVHVWLITSDFPALAAHVLVEPSADCHGVRRDLERMLARDHGIEHTTLQVDHAAEHVLSIEQRPPFDG